MLAALGAISPMALAQSAQPDVRWTVAPGGEALDILAVLPNSPAVAKSLNDAAEYVLRWKLPENAEAWSKRRPEVAQAFRKAIGLEKLPERTPLNARITAPHALGAYIIWNIT